MSAQRVWITGARGFIGRHLAAHLAESGAYVFGIGHGQFPPDLIHGTGLRLWMNAEINAESLSQLAAAHGSPDTIFHLAGGSLVGSSFASPFEDFSRTAFTTARLLEWLRGNSSTTRLVLASSAAVYGNTQGIAASEDLPPAPVSPYGYHKWMAETLCREYASVFGISAAVVRLFSVYGNGLRKQLLWDASVKIAAARGSFVLGGTGEEARDWIHIDDAVVVLQRAAEIASITCPVINGACGEGHTVRAVIGHLIRAYGKDVALEFNGQRREGDPVQLVACTKRLAQLGFRPSVSVEEGLARYAKWFSAAGVSV